MPRTLVFRPGAFGLLLRGEESFACRSNSSALAFGTAVNFRIRSLKC